MMSWTGLRTPEGIIGALAVIGLLAAAVIAFFRWLFAAPRTPDPWGPDVEQAVESEEAVPLCPHCLTPQEHNGWFCPNCGSTVGTYSNYLPNVYIYSIGEAARAGVQRPTPWNLLLIAGYLLVALGFFSLLAPVYWFLLFLNRARIHRWDTSHI